jgi:hypothetical protein
MHTFTLPDKRHVFFVVVFSQTVQRNTVYVVVAEYIQYEGLKDKHNINYRQHVNFNAHKTPYKVQETWLNSAPTHYL